MKPGGATTLPMPSSTQYSARSIAVGDTNQLTSATSVDFAPGTTIAMLLVVTGTPAHQTNPWVNTSGTFSVGTGWTIDIETNGQINLVTLNATGGQVVGSIGVGGALGAIPLTANQVACFAISWSSDAKTIKCSINGKAIATASTGSAFKHTAPSGVTQRIGGAASAGTPLDWARLVGCMLINRVVSDAELQQIAAAPHNDNPYTLPLADDASCTFQWNAQSHFTAGAGTSVSGGSSPVTFTVVGTPPVTDESFTLYDLRSVNFYDSAPNRTRTSGSLSWSERNPFARYQFDTDDSQCGIIIASSNFANATSGGLASAAAIGMTVNGGSYAAVLSDRDTSSAVSGVPVGFTASIISLGAAGTTRTVELTEGGQSNPAAPTMTNLGTFAAKVRVRSGRTFRPKRISPKARVIAVLEDSIGAGANATDLVLNGAFQKIRADGNVEIVHFGAGYRSMYDWYNDDPTFGSLCTALQQITPALTEIYVQWSRNDFGLNRWATTASYRTARKNLLLALRARFPLAKLWVQSLGFCNDAIGTGGNGFGITQAQWLAADNGAFDDAGLSNATKRNATQADYGAGALAGDGIHLSTTGQNTTWYGVIKTDLAA